MRVWLIDWRGKVWECTVVEQSRTHVAVRTVVSTELIRLSCADLAAGIVEHSMRVPLHRGERRWVPQTLRFTADADVARRHPPGPMPRDA
jgi:hypothetical protein